MRQQQARCHAVRDAISGADLLAHHVAEPRCRCARQREREPRRQLVFGPHRDVIGHGLRTRQRREEAADRLQRHHIVEGMLAGGQVSLDRMVEGADARREPQLHRRRQGQLGVVDHRFHQQARVAHAGFIAGLSRVSGPGGQLGSRERGGNGDVGEGAATAIREPDRDDLGRVDGAASAKADYSVGACARRLLDTGVDLRHGGVLRDEDGRNRFLRQPVQRRQQ